MIISKKLLESIIVEEIERFLELNPYHDKRTGRLSSAKSGNVYSLSKKAVAANGVDPSFAKKGIVTKKGKLKAKFGMAQKCGRKHIDGKDIPAEFSCSDFKQKYQEAIIEDHQDMQIAYSTILEIIQELPSALDEGTASELSKKCSQAGYISLAAAQSRILKGVNLAVLASKGTLLNSD